MLAPEDVTAFYANNTEALEVTAQMSDITPTPLVAEDVLRPPGESAVRRYVVGLDWNIAAQRFFVDDTLKAIDPTENDGWFVVIYDDPDPSGVTGLLVPVRLSEKAIQMASFPNATLATAGVVWEPRPNERPRYITAGVEITEDGNHALPAGTGSTAVIILTAAGRIANVQRTAGYNSLGNAANNYATANGARGWILRTTSVGKN